MHDAIQDPCEANRMPWKWTKSLWWNIISSQPNNHYINSLNSSIQVISFISCYSTRHFQSKVVELITGRCASVSPTTVWSRKWMQWTIFDCKIILTLWSRKWIQWTIFDCKIILIWSRQLTELLMYT